jgi:hypothetical protein
MSEPTLRVDLDPDATGRGLAELVLVVLELVRELLERQAIRRLDAGDLTPAQIEKLGTALRDAANQLQILREAVAAPALAAEPNRKDIP